MQADNEKSTRRNNTIRQAPPNEKSGDLADGLRNMTIDERGGAAVAASGDQKGSNGRRASGSSATRLPGMEERKEGKPETINYDAQRMVGHGSFGAVFQAKVVETNEVVAIKKVLQDRRFKNRELQIMRQLSKQPHPYVVLLKHYFVSKGSKADEVYLNLVLEYIPETVHSVAKMFSRAKEPMPMLSIKIYMYQLSRALAHIHGMGICHRDIKPQNLLVDPSRQILKLCDFGSAKALVKGEPNVAYICSRYYRAPELIFGSTEYTTAIDVWSEGCVLAELLIGTPVFPGSSGVDQLVEIIKVLGTPTKDELYDMNPNYQEFRFPQIRAVPWASVFKPGTPAEAMDLASKLLVYKPHQRCLAIEACGHSFFDELRNPNTTMTDAQSMFTFTEEELSLSPNMASTLIPPHMRSEQQAAAAVTAAPTNTTAAANTTTATDALTVPQNDSNDTTTAPTSQNVSTASAAANVLPSTSEEGGTGA